ncbi:MAG: ABC transporter permease [Eubacterium sp.]|nr:ABC transporter permease [Eubacterium sp.]
MINIVIAEFEKLKRYSILWIGAAAVFFVSALAIFQTAAGGVQVTYEAFVSNIIWNNFSLGFPFVIVLTGGYIINREYTDDTLKGMMTIPVSLQRLLTGKLMVTALLAVLFGVFSFVCTLAGAMLLDCSAVGAGEILRSLFQICAAALFNFVAVAPLIAWFARRKDSFFAGVGIAFFYGFCGIFVAGRHLTDFYPITAGLGIIGYAGSGGSCIPSVDRRQRACGDAFYDSGACGSLSGLR